MKRLVFTFCRSLAWQRWRSPHSKETNPRILRLPTPTLWADDDGGLRNRACRSSNPGASCVGSSAGYEVGSAVSIFLGAAWGDQQARTRQTRLPTSAEIVANSPLPSSSTIT